MAIRVLHIIGSLRLGGAQGVVKHIVESASEDVEHFVYPLRCQKIDIPIKGTILSNPYCNYDPRKFFDILKICKEYHIDIIHAHLYKPILGSLFTTYFQKIPVIVHEHGSIAQPGIQNSFYRLMLKLLRKRAAMFIAVSNAASERLTRYAKIDPDTIKVVHNAVNLEKFTPKPEQRQSIRRELDIAPEDIVIGFVGRLSYVKGPDILLDAFELLARKNPNYMLVFVGRGKIERQLQVKAENTGIATRVKFLGFRENVHEIMNAFDVAAITSRQDAFPLTPLEIMSTQIPLVSCNVDGLAEVIEHEQNALVPQENTPLKIADCIEVLTGDEKLQKSLVNNAYKTAQHFSIGNLTYQVNNIYRQIMHSKTLA